MFEEYIGITVRSTRSFWLQFRKNSSNFSTSEINITTSTGVSSSSKLRITSIIQCKHRSKIMIKNVGLLRFVCNKAAIGILNRRYCFTSRNFTVYITIEFSSSLIFTVVCLSSFSTLNRVCFICLLVTRTFCNPLSLPIPCFTIKHLFYLFCSITILFQ